MSVAIDATATSEKKKYDMEFIENSSSTDYEEPARLCITSWYTGWIP